MTFTVSYVLINMKPFSRQFITLTICCKSSWKKQNNSDFSPPVFITFGTVFQSQGSAFGHAQSFGRIKIIRKSWNHVDTNLDYQVQPNHANQYLKKEEIFLIIQQIIVYISRFICNVRIGYHFLYFLKFRLYLILSSSLRSTFILLFSFNIVTFIRFFSYILSLVPSFSLYFSFFLYFFVFLTFFRSSIVSFFLFLFPPFIFFLSFLIYLLS